MLSLTPKEYYLWRIKSESAPWDRQYRDIEFLKSEKKRITDTKNWHENYLKLKEGDQSGEVTYYVLPAIIPKSWQMAADALGAFVCRGLSALRNSPQSPLIALFGKGTLLKDYSLIRIISARKIILLNKELPMQHNCEYALIVDSFEEIAPDYLYKDVPFEKRRVSDVLYEHLGHDNFVAHSLQSPLLSSPFVMNKYGGIGLSKVLYIR